jgi:hypothetical protein
MSSTIIKFVSLDELQDREAVSDAKVLGQVEAYIRRFVAYPSEHARVAHTLWIAHTHLMECWESTPRLAFLSAERGSGKTRALEVTEPLVPSPVHAVNVSPAYLFRKVGDQENGRSTILYDEIDTLFGSKAQDTSEVRALLNAGHRRGAVVGRCLMVGKKVVTEELPAYCAVAIAGIGGLPDTIASRAILVTMRRRASDETVEPFRAREHIPQASAIREGLARWCGAIAAVMQAARPGMPQGVEDRNADCWEPLLAIADAAGGEWPQRARAAALALIAGAAETNAPRVCSSLATFSTSSVGTRSCQQRRFCTDSTTFPNPPGQIFAGSLSMIAALQSGCASMASSQRSCG